MRPRHTLAVYALLLGLLAAVVVYAYSRSRVDVVFTAQGAASGELQVFNAADGGFSEAESSRVPLPERRSVEGHLRYTGRDATQLRFDPPLRGATRLCDLRVGHSERADEYEILSVDEVDVSRDTGCLRLQPDHGARDPKVVIRFVGASARSIRHAGVWHMIFYAALSALLLCSYWLYRRYRRTLRRSLAAVPVPAGFKVFDENVHWIGAALMLVLGIAYVFITPPGAVADEGAHLAKIIRVSQGIAFGGSGSTPLPDFRKMYGPFSNYSNNKAIFTSAELKAQITRKLVCTPTSTTLPQGANSYFPHQCLLPSLAFKASCATGASFGLFLYSARLLNLLLAVVLVHLGLRLATRGKWALFAIALLPMSLFQMASLSADSLSISLGIAWLGVVSGIAGRRLSPGHALPLLWGLSLAIALSKPGAAWVLVCLVFCKPAFDAAGRSFSTAVLKFVVLPWAIHAACTLLAAEGAGALAGVDAIANAHSLRTDPLIFVHAWLNTLFGDHVQSLARMLVGVLGWIDVPLSRWAYPAGGLALLSAFWTNESSMLRMSRFVPLAALTFAIGSTAMIALPLFIYWSPLELGFIQGLQGRYFTVTAAFVMVWCSFRSMLPIRALLVSLIVVVLLSINIDALYKLQQAYFVVGRA